MVETPGRTKEGVPVTAGALPAQSVAKDKITAEQLKEIFGNAGIDFLKKVADELGSIFGALIKKVEATNHHTDSPFAEITDDDIDNLFRE